MTMYYSEVDGAEPTISFSVKDTRYTLTNESLVKLVEEKENLKTELLQVERKLKSTQFDVKEFFQARYETDHHEIVCEVGDVNDLLKDIGADELTKSWSATVSITATVTGIEAPNADAAREIIEDAFEINLTVDGDVWVDDLMVESCYPEA
jgi:thymidylate synthase ThyX